VRQRAQNEAERQRAQEAERQRAQNEAERQRAQVAERQRAKDQDDRQRSVQEPSVQFLQVVAFVGLLGIISLIAASSFWRQRRRHQPPPRQDPQDFIDEDFTFLLHNDISLKLAKSKIMPTRKDVADISGVIIFTPIPDLGIQSVSLSSQSNNDKQ